MKLEYKILWIEDTPISTKRDKRKTIEYIENLGFDCVVTDVVDFETFEVDIGYENTKNYDLLLVDLDLGDDEKGEGNSIIRKVREEKIYTEIVFYSSHYEQLLKKLNGNFVEGIFTSSRDELLDKIMKIVDLTIKKTQDVNNLRGLIMAEVAELDRLKKNIVKKYCQKTKNSDNELKGYIKNNIFSDFSEKIEKYNFLTSKEENSHTEMNVSEFIDDLMFLSDKKARTMNKINNKEKTGIEFNVEDYRKNIISKRNVFAHEEENSRIDGSRYLNYPNGKPLEFDEEHCIQIRKDIKRYKNILEEIESKI